MVDYNRNFYQGFPTPKTNVAQNHKNICVLQTKSMASSNMQLKIDTGSMYIIKKNPKNQNIVKEVSFFPHPFSPKTTKSIISFQTTKVIEKLENKPNGLLEKIACLLEKNKAENILHHQSYKRIKHKKRFPPLEKEKIDLSTYTSLKVAKLSSIAVKNLFSTRSNAKLMRNKSQIINPLPMFEQSVITRTINFPEIIAKPERNNANGDKKIEMKRKIIRNKEKTMGNLEKVVKNLETFFDGHKDDNQEQVEDFVAYVRKSKEFS